MNTVYRMFDENDELLYVGITANLPGRLAQHRAEKPWWTLVARIELRHLDSRREALDSERYLIVTEKPLWNVVHRDGATPIPWAQLRQDFPAILRLEAGARAAASDPDYCSVEWYIGHAARAFDDDPKSAPHRARILTRLIRSAPPCGTQPCPGCDEDAWDDE